jgi:uroporphyrinogen decarboxylase
LFRGGALPRFEAGGFWDQTLERWRGEGLPPDADPWDYFSLDRYMDNAPPGLAYHCDRVITPAYWPPFEPRVLQETEDWILELRDDGITARRLRRGTSVPQFISYPVAQPSDWEGVERRLDAGTPERWAGLADAARAVKDRDTVLRLGLCGAYGTLRNLFGPENLCYALYDSPDLIRRMLRRWAEFSCGLADRLCAAVEFDYVFLWEDMAFKTGPLVSPSQYREFMLPCCRDLIGYLGSRHGLDIVMIDSDGNDWDLLPLFIEAGVNVFTPLEIAAGMEPLAIRERFPRLALLGGIDKRALPFGRQAIRREIERKVPPLLAGGGYFPSLDHHVPADVSFEDFCIYLEEIRVVAP